MSVGGGVSLQFKRHGSRHHSLNLSNRMTGHPALLCGRRVPRTAVTVGSTHEAPRTLPVGIPHVLIDGRFVIEDGKRTDVVAGRSVRGGRRDR